MPDRPLTTIAVAYRSSTAATTICALEAAGFDVFCPGYHIANMLPHYTLAIGGIAIAVPAGQRKDALILLHGFSPSDPPTGSRIRKALDGLGWLGFGVSSPWPDLLLKDIPREWLDTREANR